MTVKAKVRPIVCSKTDYWFSEPCLRMLNFPLAGLSDVSFLRLKTALRGPFVCSGYQASAQQRC